MNEPAIASNSATDNLADMILEIRGRFIVANPLSLSQVMSLALLTGCEHSGAVQLFTAPENSKSIRLQNKYRQATALLLAKHSWSELVVIAAIDMATGEAGAFSHLSQNGYG